MSSDWRQGTLLWMAATLSGLSGYMAAWNSVWTKPGNGKLSLIKYVVRGTWGYSAHTNVAPNVSELLSPSLQKSSHSKLWGSVKPGNFVIDYKLKCVGHLPRWRVWRDPVSWHWPYHDDLPIINLVCDHRIHAQLGAQTKSCKCVKLYKKPSVTFLTEYIDIQHCSPRLHRAIPQCFRGAQTGIVNANINLK